LIRDSLDRSGERGHRIFGRNEKDYFRWEKKEERMC
jgi:hypothetical protein